MIKTKNQYLKKKFAEENVSFKCVYYDKKPPCFKAVGEVIILFWKVFYPFFLCHKTEG